MEATPLKLARKARGMTLEQVSAFVGSDTGNLSRIENGKQTPSPELAEKLAVLFAEQGLTEMHIFFPERYNMSDSTRACDDATTPINGENLS